MSIENKPQLYHVERSRVMGFHETHSGVEVILLSRSKEKSLRRDLNNVLK